MALVTGVSGGIGKAIAERLLKDGFYVYGQFRSNEADLIKWKDQVNNGENIYFIKANLMEEEDIKKLTHNLPPLTAFVHCAGQSLYGFLEDYTVEEINNLWQVHVVAPALIMKNLSSNFRTKKNSSIIIVSSIWGDVGAALESIYASVKAAQITFVKSMAKEWASSGVRINSVLPGLIHTKMNETFSEEELEEIISDIPLGRMGVADDVAGVVSFLISSSSAYITGQQLKINGGWEG
ncbi:elongation factor P 5-aminopentanone reductase [Mangrovibacillus cuniculi]|uniref:elongation factor P 5-aminopentanone reductase n=1 Tax=Mangrovibacillus cuniculi TaxID=2593652 RepID=UPI001EFA1B9D|nr:SDR family oxidoreductase [Mangrovibacillus cuniculi]